MSIIYSYPTSQPTVDDLLIGTDVNDENATKSFSVQSLVSLINASQNNGIITDVTISTSDVFLTAVKTSGIGVPAITYTVGLTSLPTAGIEATQFLRGDNQWVVPTVSAGISVLDNNITVTNDLQALNFTGAGVTTALTATGAVSVTIAGAQQGVTSVNVGTGISTTATTGNIVLTNTGVTSIIAGGGIAIDKSTGAITISTTNQSQGTVTSVTAGSGLTLASGTITTDPELALSYTGQSTYITIPETGAPIASDTLPFQKGVSGVRETTFSTIPVNALTLVEAAINASAADVVKNNTDVYSSLGDVDQIVTLTQTEWTNLATKDGNTLYLTVTSGSAPTTFTKTLAITDTITGGVFGTDYTYTGNVAGNTLTGPSGNSFAFSTGISVTNPAKYFPSAPSIVNATGTFNANDEVTTSISGAMQAVPVYDSTATLSTSWNIASGYNAATENLDYSISYNAPAQRTNTTNATLVPSALWGVTVSNDIPAKWSLTGGSVTYGGTFQYQNNTITANILGTMTLRTYDLSYVIDDTGITGGSAGTDYDIDITGSFGTLQNQLTGTANLPYNANASAYSIVVTVQNKGNNTVSMTSANPVTQTSALIANTSIPTITLTGSVSANATTISVNTLSNPSGPAAGYTVPTFTWQATGGGAATTNGTITGLTGSFPANIGQTVTISSVTSVNAGYTVQTALVDTLSSSSFTVTQATTVSNTRSGAVIVALLGFTSTGTSQNGSAATACAAMPGYASYYFDGSSGYPIQGNKVYSDQAGNNPLPTGYYAYYDSNLGSNLSIQVTSGGNITQNATGCGLP